MRNSASGTSDEFVPARPDDLVSFSVVCQPKSGQGIEGLRHDLTLKTVGDHLPAREVRADVVRQLKELGFEVFDLADDFPIVSARGTVRLFEEVFGGHLERLIRTTIVDGRERKSIAIVPAKDSPRPSPERIRGAVLIAVARPPRFVVPAIPPATAGFNLHLPGDIAQLTRASATHRRRTPAGQRATGYGMHVAVLDADFAPHRYYSDHGYRITRLAAPDASEPDEGAGFPHGTFMLAFVHACAPDAHTFGIKMGADAALALGFALTIPAMKVISISWAFSLDPTDTVVPDDYLPLYFAVLFAVGLGVTVIAAAGDGDSDTFPAMIPEVIAVGGVSIDEQDRLFASDQSSSFPSRIFADRYVPDCCGLSSGVLVPYPGNAWEAIEGGTSCATPQVAGVAALLLQKNPTLTPSDVRKAVMKGATDVILGASASGDTAGVGVDRATGAGLVNARRAWQIV